MKLSIKESKLKGNIDIIPSKSYAHRYILASFLARAEQRIINIPLSDDVYTTLNAIKSLGASYEISENVCVINYESERNDVIECMESASTLRFIIPIALALYSKAKIKVSKRLLDRGIDEYIKIFKTKKINVNIHDDLIEINGKLKGGAYIVDGSKSSQYVTGLLLALPILDDDSVIKINEPINSKSYIDITLSILDEYGISYERIENKIFIKGKQRYRNISHYVEGDYSNAAFIDAFNYFGSDIKINGLKEESLQGDKIYKEYFELLNKGYQELDISNAIDLGPILFVFASLKHGAKFTGTDRLNLKESNRSSAIKEELSKLGISVEIGNDFVIINQNSIKPKNVCFNSHNDHRIAMALSLYSSVMDIEINDYECVKKSYKEYFDVLRFLGAKVDYE